MATYDTKDFRKNMIQSLKRMLSDSTPFVFSTLLRDEMYAEAVGTKYELNNGNTSREHWIVCELYKSIQNICGSRYSGMDGLYYAVEKYDTNIGYNISVHMYDEEDIRNKKTSIGKEKTYYQYATGDNDILADIKEIADYLSEIIKKDKFSKIMIQDKDSIEIVSLVGGG